MNEYIDFKVSMVKDKPVTVNGGNTPCPFCDWGKLKKNNIILEETNDLLWLENKFPTFSRSYQTVLVEHQACDEHFGSYNSNHRTRILAFAIEKWLALEGSGRFKSVCMIKNHGPLSGASIKHPHLQIVGFEEADIYHDIEDSNFEGVEIFKDDKVEFNISRYPRGESYEFNVILNDLAAVGKMGDMIAITVNYILEKLNPIHQSFNFVFYRRGERIIAKIIPRYPVSVYVVGYAVSLRPMNIEEVAKDIMKTKGVTDGTSSP